MFLFSHLPSRTKKIVILFLGSVVYFISRLAFITQAPIFFDSAEYLSRFQQANYFTAIDSGHVPLHAGYVILFWPIFHLAQLLHLSPVTSVLMCQIGLSLLGVLLFGTIVKILTQDLRTAVISMICGRSKIYLPMSLIWPDVDAWNSAIQARNSCLSKSSLFCRRSLPTAMDLSNGRRFIVLFVFVVAAFNAVVSGAQFWTLSIRY